MCISKEFKGFMVDFYSRFKYYFPSMRPLSLTIIEKKVN